MIAKRRIRHAYAIGACLVMLAGCQESTTSQTKPVAVAMTEEAIGHYCNMSILEHEGPKAQIHLAEIDHPIWFSQVRDAVAFLRSPEEHFTTTAIYVHDMGKAANWADPGDGAWIDAETAFFVIGSAKTGGMGAPEAIPFGNLETAQSFVDQQGGSVVSLTEITDDYVLSPVDLTAQHAH